MGRYNLKYGTIGAPIAPEPAEPPCYTDEWKRSSPDCVVFLPREFIGCDSFNVDIVVEPTPRGALVAVWTTGTYETADNMGVVSARSEDGGET